MPVVEWVPVRSWKRWRCQRGEQMCEVRHTAIAQCERHCRSLNWAMVRPTTQRQLLECKFTPEPNTGCWLWFGAIDGWGYGSVGVNGKAQGAHRVVYEEFTGTKIPAGMELDHLCRVRNCVNPDHLEIVTHRENLLRGDTWTRHGAEQTHCKRGHEFTPENTIRSRHNNFTRRCRECERAFRRAAYVKRRAVLAAKRDAQEVA